MAHARLVWGVRSRLPRCAAGASVHKGAFQTRRPGVILVATWLVYETKRPILHISYNRKTLKVAIDGRLKLPLKETSGRGVVGGAGECGRHGTAAVSHRRAAVCR